MNEISRAMQKEGMHFSTYCYIDVFLVSCMYTIRREIARNEPTEKYKISN